MTDFSKMTVAQLHEVAVDRAIKFTTKMRKAELIALINADIEGAQKAKRSTHLPNAERVQGYAMARWTREGEQRVNRRFIKLTPKQMRRVRKNANKHGDTLRIKWAGISHECEKEQGYSLLARTPEGLGIFHKTGV